MADQLTIDLIDKVRAAKAVYDEAFEARNKAAEVMSDAIDALGKASQAHRQAETELRMAVEERHPDQLSRRDIEP